MFLHLINKLIIMLILHIVKQFLMYNKIVMFKDFKKFLVRGNVVDLAVAVLVGAAFNNVITSFVKDLITPLTGIFTGHATANLNNYVFKINGTAFNYGNFVSNLISFLIVAIVVFFFVVQPLNKLIELTNLKVTPNEKKCTECLSSIPKKATRCKFCTVKVD